MGKLSVVFGLVVSLILLGGQPCFASLKTNTSGVVVALTSQTASRVVVFPYPIKDLIIQNNDTTRYVWIDLTSTLNGIGFPANTVDTGRCVLLAPSQSMELYDFITEGMTISGDNAVYGAAGGASPIVVEATY